MSWLDPWEAIEAVALNDDPVERALARASPAVREMLDRALARNEMSAAEAETLATEEEPVRLVPVRQIAQSSPPVAPEPEPESPSPTTIPFPPVILPIEDGPPTYVYGDETQNMGTRGEPTDRVG